MFFFFGSHYIPPTDTPKNQKKKRPKREGFGFPLTEPNSKKKKKGNKYFFSFVNQHFSDHRKSSHFSHEVSFLYQNQHFSRPKPIIVDTINFFCHKMSLSTADSIFLRKINCFF